jgi:uncharacterized membrane protein YphA (DoxX/SURF4 family)
VVAFGRHGCGRKPRLKMSAFATVATIWLGSMFLYSGSLKFVNRSTSVASIREYRLLPTSAAGVVGRMLPFIEVGAGALLLAGYGYLFAAATGAALGASFLVASFHALHSEIDIECGCTGRGDERVSRMTVARALAILGGCVMLLALGAGGTPRLPIAASAIIAALALLPSLIEARQHRRLRGLRGVQHFRVETSADELARLTEVLAAPPAEPTRRGSNYATSG